LHGCCHNPTGANLTNPQWKGVVDLLKEKSAVPFVDIAYQGFGDGLAEDGAATRLVASSFDNVLIAASCSKNFGVYRERTGILMSITKDTAQRDLAQQNMAFLNRQNFSFPPDHGARVVTTILNDPELRADWEAELEEVRLGMLELRKQLAAELRRLSNTDRFDFLAEHRGMFSQLGTTPELVEKLRADHGIYMVGDSRMNIAGLNAKTIPVLAKAIIDAGI
ncbi:MAG TPA: aromatic amino acid aminotransferase, partial [Octadecabacter sp.]|nr:aromatic amino acid aminotransferase [Octadecabacter sp.]